MLLLFKDSSTSDFDVKLLATIDIINSSIKYFFVDELTSKYNWRFAGRIINILYNIKVCILTLHTRFPFILRHMDFFVSF